MSTLSYYIYIFYLDAQSEQNAELNLNKRNDEKN